METSRGFRFLGCLALLGASASVADDIFKANNALPLNDAGSWEGGFVPAATNTAVWDSRVLAGNTVADIGGALTWGGVRVESPGGAVAINGADRLTLDGSAAVDIDMSASAQDLTLNTPVTLGGSSAVSVNAGCALSVSGAATVNSLTKSGEGLLLFGASASVGSGTYAAGQTVYAGTTTVSGDTRLTGGTVCLRGATLMAAGSTEALAVYNGSLVLDGGALAMTNANSRFFAGRTDATSDGLIIVSNGTHTVLGNNGTTMANFVGVSGAKRGRLVMEGGRLTLVLLRLATNHKAPSDDLADEIRVRGGVLSVTNAGSTAFMMGTSHMNDGAEASRSALLEITGGRFEVPNGSLLVSTDGGSTQSQTQTVSLAGGVLSVKKITVGSKANAVKNFWFNGGVLQATNAAADAELIDGSDAGASFSVQSRGLLLDSGSGSVRLSKNLAEDPASAGGGLVKLGSGTLTLSGANGYTGRTIVSNGTLRLAGTLAVTNLVVEPGAGLSLADGVLSASAPSALRIGSAGVSSRLELEVAASGGGSDTLVLPAGAWFQKVDVALVQQGTLSPVACEGDFAILKYDGAAPSAGWLSWANPVLGFTCAFEADSASRTIYARVRVSPASGQSVWINPAGGAWEAAANWSAMPASAAGAKVWLGEVPPAPATVTLDAPFTVGQMVLSNANAYTLSGAGTLTLDNGSSASAIDAALSAHTVSLPLTLASSLTVTAASGAGLTASGAIGGPGALRKQGAGDLYLTQNNTYSGGTTLSGGMLALFAGASLGSGPISLAVNNGRLRSAGTEPVTITNDVVVTVSGSALDALAPMIFTGALDWAPGQAVIQKFGAGELIFKGKASESGSCQINQRTGTLRLADGASVLINNANARNSIYLADGTSAPRAFIVETGAVMVAGGIYTGSGPSNTVYVNGGSLTLTGSGANGENGLVRVVEDVPGADRIIVDAGSLTFSPDDWLSLGVRGGGAEVIVNGGTATFGRLSLGVRGDTGFGSSGVSTYAKLWVNGGVLDVAGALNWLGDVTPGRVNRVFLNGGTLRLPATLRSVALSIASGSELTLNGGTLELRGLGNYGSTSLDNYLSGLTSLYVDQGGAVIDTLGNSATITQALQRVDATTGGLTKRGAGALALAGPCGAVGPTVVEAGTLRFASATATTALSVSNNAALSLRNGAFDTLSLSAAALADGARLDLDVAAAGTSCDQVALPAGAAVGRLVIGLYNLGTDTPVTGAATFPIFSYAGTPPDPSGWTLAPDMFGVTCAFVVNTGASTIDAQIAYTDKQAAWANAGSGDWSAATNWWPQAPAASGAVVRFGRALAGDATVNVDGAVSVAAMVFDHAFRYTLSGSAITVSNGVSVLSGSHTLAGPLTLSGDAVASLASGASLQIKDVVSGAGSLTVEGGGQLALDGTNTTPTTVRGGSAVAVPDADSLGGAALTLDGGTLTVATSDTLAGTVSLGASGGTFRGGAGQTLQLDATVSGAGGLTKAGAGALTLSSAALGYGGVTTADGGTLSAADLPSGGLVLGRGTLAFTGTSDASSQPVTIASGTNAAVLRADGDLTLSGPIATASGALFKSGAGSVTIAGANTNRIGASNAANMGGVAADGADGDGPAAGFGAFNVAQGRVTLGAAGQTNTISGALLVGLNTTSVAGAETAGELVVAGGLTACSDWTYVGRNNGTTVTAPGGLASRLLVQDGELSTVNLSLGGASGFAGYTGRPVLEILGGTCTVQAVLYAGETAGGVSTLWVNGGTLRHLATTDISLRLGNSGGEGVLRVSSGLADVAKDIILGSGGAGSTGTVELAGGVLIAQNIYENVAAGTSRVIFNGGVFRPRGGAMSGLDSAKIGAGPAIFDTSLYSGAGYNLAQALSGLSGTDGGLVKAGTNTLNINATMAYNGPTVVSAGVLRVVGALPAATALTVAPGARLAVNNATAKKVTVGSLTLGDASSSTPAELELGVDSPNATNDQLVATGALTAHRAAFHLYWQSSQMDNIVANGKYALIRYSGTDPDPAAFSVANPVPGKTYTFSVEGQTLFVQVGASTSGAYVWSSAGGGDWSDSAKWVSAPGAGATGAVVRFDASIASPSSVRLNQNTTLGGLYFNSTNAYAVAADGVSVMTVDSGAGAATVQVEQGRHLVSAPLALQSDLQAKPVSGTGLTLAGVISGAGGLVKMNGGDLILGATNTFGGQVRLTSGSLVLTNGATAGSGTLGLEGNGAQVRASGATPSVLTNTVAVRTTSPVVAVDAQAQLTLKGTLSYEAAGTNTLYKQGAGELTLAGSANAPTDSARVNLQEGTVRFSSGANYRIGNADRDVVKMDTDNSRARALVVDAGAKATLSGVFMAYGTNAVVVDGTLDFTGSSDAACLRIQGNAAEDRFTVRAGGAVTCPQATWFNVGVRGPGVLAVEGGAAQLGCVSLGYQQKPADSFGGSYGRAFVTGGGLLDVTGKWNWMGDSNAPARVNLLLAGDGSPAGGTVRLPPTTQTTATGWSSLGLNSGTLVTTGGGLSAPVAGDYLNGLKQLYVGAGGGTFDTAGQSVTLSQPVCADQPGGALAKAGAGTLELAQPLRWDGTVDVRGGTLSAALAAAACRQASPSNLLARYSFENGPTADTSGSGRHGVQAGSVTMAAGTNGAYSLSFETGASLVSVPCDPVLRGLPSYTVAMWLWLSATNASANTPTTFFTTRKDNGSSGPYEFMLRMNYNKVRFMATGAGTTWVSYDSTIPVPGTGQWVHVACAVTTSGVGMYINGAVARTPQAGDLKTFLFCPPDRPLTLPAFGFGNYHLASAFSGQFKGGFDDVRIYSRALSQAEVQALMSVSPALPSLRVAGGALFAAQGGTNTVQDLSGEGAVSGALKVVGSVSAGDSTNAPAGAVLAAEDLTIGTNAVYRWTWSPELNDELQVGRLTIDGAGVLDFGRSESDPVTGPFRAVLMRYSTLTGCSNFAGWTFANAGRKGFVAEIVAADGEVILTFLSRYGSVMLLR